MLFVPVTRAHASALLQFMYVFTAVETVLQS